MSPLTAALIVLHLALAALLTILGLIAAAFAALADSVFFVHVFSFLPSILLIPTALTIISRCKQDGLPRPNVTGALIYAFSSLWIVYLYIYFFVQYLITGVW